jgi:hypothetical protein
VAFESFLSPLISKPTEVFVVADFLKASNFCDKVCNLEPAFSVSRFTSGLSP